MSKLIYTSSFMEKIHASLIYEDKLHYPSLLNKYPWIVEPKQKCILSPDSDGFLCGLLMTNLLNFDVVGFYDGKILTIKNNCSIKDCIILDMDLNRPHVRSIGHHMVTYNKKLSPPNYNYSNCIQPNIIRNFDGINDFQQKYPFATIHLLLGILQAAKLIGTLKPESIWPLLFTDGVWNNLFGYTENCIEWIRFLGIERSLHILNPLFCTSGHSFYKIMHGLNDFLRERDSFNAEGYYCNSTYVQGGRNKRTGDKLKITNPKGNVINLEKTGATFKMHDLEKTRIEGFISTMARYFGFAYVPSKWCWSDLRISIFEKSDFTDKKLNNTTYTALMATNPLSLAMTSGLNIEYTLERPDQFI